MIPETLKTALRQEGTLELTLKVIPKSSRDEIVGPLDDGSIRVKITAAPEKGKANAAVCRLLADAFDVGRSSVEILRGATSQTKRVRITRK
jgi:uncharacterized protein (TIGR00251 family)